MTTHKPNPETNAEFDAWVASLPAKSWAKYDLSACRLGWDAARAALPAQPVVAVKPLEWVGEDHSRPGSRARTIVGVYALWTVEDGRVFLKKPEDFKGVVVGTGVDATKAAAQADYEARICSALAAPSQQEGVTEHPDAAVLHALASDPNVVHINLLRGSMARPTVEQIIHIYGKETLEAALVDGVKP
jgi:hypothetical protein